MIKIAHIADTHISVTHPRYTTLRRALSTMITQIAEARPNLIVHAGDLGELHPSAVDLYDQAVFLQQLAGIAPTILVAGNHDSNPHLNVLARIGTEERLWISTAPDTLALMGGEIFHLSDIDPTEVECVECVIHALPWTAKARVRSWYLQQTGHAAPEETADQVAQEFLGQIFTGFRSERMQAEYQGPSILLGHLDVSGAKLDSGQPNAAAGMQVSVHDLASATTSACLLGHVHAQQELGDDGEGIFYAGSPCRLTWGEAEAESKGWGLLKVPDGPGMQYERMDIPSPRLWTVEARWEPEDCIEGGWWFHQDPPDFFPWLLQQKELGLVGENDELRYRYHVPEDQREAAKAARKHELTVAVDCGIDPENVTFDPVVEPTDHARAPEIASQSDPVDMHRTWAEQDGRLERVTPEVEEKIREIADGLGFHHGVGGDNGSTLLEHTRLRVHGVGRLRDVDVTIPEGITAITGPNGHGKSTILRSFLWGMHRKAPRGKDTDSLGKWAVTKDAHLILDSQNGVPITAAHTLNGERKSVAQSAVLTVDGQILNESGLVKEFDAKASELYPNYDLYLASAFAEQEGAGAFHSASVAERKAVLRKALHLDEIEALSEEAKRLRKSAEIDIAVIETRIRDLPGDVLEELREALRSTRMEQRAYIAQVDELVPQIREARTAQAEAEAAWRSVEKTREEWHERRRIVARLTQEVAETEQGVKRALEAADRLPQLQASLEDGRRLRDRLDEVRAEYEEQNRELVAKREKYEEHERSMRDAQGELDELQSVLSRAVEIRAAAGKVEDLEGTLSEATAEAQAIEEEIEKTQKRVEAHTQVRHDVEWLEEKLGVIQRGNEDIAAVPFGDKCLESGCPFVARVVDGESHEKVRLDLETARAKLDPESLSDRAKAEQRLRATRESVREASDALKAARAAAADLPLLEDAEPRAEKLREVLTAKSALLDTLKTTGQALAAEVARLKLKVDDLETRLGEHHPRGLDHTLSLVSQAEAEASYLPNRQERLSSIQGELGRSQESLGEEPSGEAARERMDQARILLADLEEAERNHRQAIEQVSIRIATLEEQIRVAEESETKRRELEAQVANLHQEAADWKFIEAGFSKSGVQALLMDAMGPAISEQSNRILEEVGSEYRIQLTTTRKDSTGKKVLEDLDILVSGEGLFPGATMSNLSPGQRVVVGLAFRLGLCLYYGGGGVSPWLLDEADGGLDDENIKRYVPIIRSAMKVGQVNKVMFVTHREESRKAADNELYIEEGRARLEARS